jgi:hypothetical protein
MSTSWPINQANEWDWKQIIYKSCIKIIIICKFYLLILLEDYLGKKYQTIIINMYTFIGFWV